MARSVIGTTILMLMLAGLALAGCGSQEIETPAPAATGALEGGDAMESPLPAPEVDNAPSSEAQGAPEGGEAETLRMALLPVLDVLPFHVAEQNGFFRESGLEVQLVPVKSGQERDTLMQTGQVDGMLTDLLSPVLFNQDEPLVKAVRTARRAYADAPLFYLLAAPGSDVEAAADLAGVEIGIAQNTVIAYLTDRMLEDAGLAADQIAVREVSAIPVRFELLVNGELPAATLPDPLASGALAAGAVHVVDDSSVPELSQSILAFSTEALETKGEAVRSFLKAWEMAVEELNGNPGAYQDLLIEKGRVPESIQGTFAMPPFPGASVPSPEQLEDILAWALGKGIVGNQVPYEWMVDDSFLP